MAEARWCPKEDLMREARLRFEEPDVMLDIGCGIMPQGDLVPLVHICVEPYEEYVDVLRAKTREASDRSYVILQATWAEALKVLPAKSVDTVILADVIEHLEKAEAGELLRQTEAIARRQILIFTPLGFMPQCHPDGVDAWGLGGAQWQEHRSGWTPEDFGAGWEFIGSKEYYFEDNLGRPLIKPYGAFWAIRTFDAGVDGARLEKRALTRRFSALAAAMNYSVLVRHTLGAMGALAVVRTAASKVYRAVVPVREGRP